MDDTHCIDYRSTGFFSKLICDYLEQKPELQRYYNRFPNIENFKGQIEEKKQFPEDQRHKLTEALKKQYEHLFLSTLDTEQSAASIEALSKSNTFTIVTGHQLNIFTGPLYFLYKIVSAINLTKELKKEYPTYNFVPVYWMATEDHDFAEINHISVEGDKLSWNRPDGGPVGRFTTDGIEVVIEELKEKLGPGTFAKDFIKLLKESYLENSNLAEATRYLTHSLFGNEGLVIVDGDDASLKESMIPYFEKDLFENQAYTKVQATSSTLAKDYFEQVHPREINLFYIQNGLRQRIVAKDDQWEVLDTQIRFTEIQLKEELQQKPENFSPNVILRPLYQEVILPNLAYIGGGGELAYWLQLKDMFEAYDVPFPILMLRNSALWIDEKEILKIEKSELNIEDIFQPLSELKRKYVNKYSPLDPELQPYEEKLLEMFDDLEEVANLTDRSMLGAVNAQRQKQLNGLENLKKKLIRAEKKRLSIDMSRLDSIHHKLFPNGSLQERSDNLSIHFREHGLEFIAQLKDDLEPLDFRFRVIKASGY